jgi:acetyl-CoA carboxylase biotin carboxylase subunit
MSAPKLLIANRGEIAVRIIRACRALGISPVAVYSEPDRDALHVRMADWAVPIGPAPAKESYLVVEKLLDAAAWTGATFVHPGFGFLSENAEFAQAVIDRGLTWVGPKPSSIAAMGSKTESRRRMVEAKVPVVPGMTAPARDAAELVAFGKEHGFPLLLKAAAGGGGKGMRVVRSAEEVPAAFERTRSEAQSFFADSAVYAELYVERSRHVEVQVLGDKHGRVVAVGERECSLQRRHQKVLEECPSPVVGQELRERMQAVAVAAAKAVDYESAGTVEFLLAQDGRFFFLEMNTRIQVEHPVTEMVYGIDLVGEMIRIARGEPMTLPQVLDPRGHAIECRIYAEDPARNFAPSPGAVKKLRWPGGPGIRIDAGLEEGDTVPLDYDPMVAKLITWGEDRPKAIARMISALQESRVEGIESSIPFFLELLADPDVAAGHFSTQFLDTWKFQGSRVPEAGLEDFALVAAALDAVGRSGRASLAGPEHGPSAWRTARPTYGRRD